MSEGSQYIRIYIENKKNLNKEILIKTIDVDATGDEDYEAINRVMKFTPSEREKYIEIKIFDDDHWEPDEDFLVQLYDTEGMMLEGKDTQTKVTIIDDDKPGQICFADDGLDADATQPHCEIAVLRKNGADGEVTLNYETVEIDNSKHTATAGIDFVKTQGQLTFGNQETI